MIIDLNAIAEEVKKGPHWRVSFRPSPYKENRFKEPKEALKMIEQTAVLLRGWDYPHLGDKTDEVVRTERYVSSGADFASQKEVWRLYYSGQFINLFGVPEKTSPEWHDRLRKITKQRLRHYREIDFDKVPGFIDIINFLYCATEIFEFAARLCEKGLYEESLEISIQLNNIDDFVLTTSDFMRAWFRYYHASSNTLTNNAPKFEVTDLLASSSELALESVLYFFQLFGWDNPSTDVLKAEQQKFLSRKL